MVRPWKEQISMVENSSCSRKKNFRPKYYSKNAFFRYYWLFSKGRGAASRRKDWRKKRKRCGLCPKEKTENLNLCAAHAKSHTVHNSEPFFVMLREKQNAETKTCAEFECVVLLLNYYNFLNTYTFLNKI